MDHAVNEQSDDQPSDDEQQKIAVPYIPPPPPDGSNQKKFRSPFVNGVILAIVILLGGFMAYNFFGNELTQLAGDSYTRSVSTAPSTAPATTSVPYPSASPSPSQ